MKWNTTKAAKEFGASRETVIRALKERGLHVQKGSQFTTLQIATALFGSGKQERTRLTKFNADMAQIEVERERGNLVEFKEVSELFSQILLPIRQWMLNLPSSAAGRCNPADPELARLALQRIVDEALPQVRKKLPQPRSDAPTRRH